MEPEINDNRGGDKRLRQAAAASGKRRQAAASSGGKRRQAGSGSSGGGTLDAMLDRAAVMTYSIAHR